jgi:beta-lactamase regulating signal transducer with metallopeptidase domain
MISALLDHVWQSTVFAGGIALLTLLFRRNGAAIRFWLWFAASLKFVLPFALLGMLGEVFFRVVPALPPSALAKSIQALQPAAEKFSAPARMLAPDHADSLHLGPLPLGVWLLGLAVILGVHILRWSRMRLLLAHAHEISLAGPVPIKASDSLLEPGLVGILRPVVLLPSGLMPRLTLPERDSILAHEFSHLARRDNAAAAFHMAVEALFWFYPPVWFIGSRLIAERERACDENVLACGHDPEVYAGGILKVCKFCIQSPLICAAGATGADLNRRMRQIMTAPPSLALSPAKQVLLAGSALLAVGLPILAGFPETPLAVSVKRNVLAAQARAEEAVGVVAEQIGMAPVTRVTVKKLPRLKIQMAAILPSLPHFEEPAAPPGEPSAPVAQTEPSVAVAADVAPLPRASAKQVVLALTPMGDGDPDAITCRVPQTLPGSRLPGPQVCKMNRVWAAMRANREDISPDGKLIVYLDDFTRHKAISGNCQATFFGRSGVFILPGPSTTFCF